MEHCSGADISVCLLTYNQAHIVESTIRSILDQSRRDFEFIVSDDCSTDGTWEKILEIAAADPKIKAVRIRATSECRAMQIMPVLNPSVPI